MPFHVVCLCHKTNIKLFLLNNTIHLFCYFKNYVKAVLPVPAKRSVNRWNKVVLVRGSRNDSLNNLGNLYLPNELGDLFFQLHISNHHNVGNNREKFKENLTTTSVTTLSFTTDQYPVISSTKKQRILQPKMNKTHGTPALHYKLRSVRSNRN